VGGGGAVHAPAAGARLPARSYLEDMPNTDITAFHRRFSAVRTSEMAWQRRQRIRGDAPVAMLRRMFVAEARVARRTPPACRPPRPPQVSPGSDRRFAAAQKEKIAPASGGEAARQKRRFIVSR